MNDLKKYGVNVETIKECEFERHVKKLTDASKYLPSFYQNHHKGPIDVLHHIRMGELFGMVELDLHVPNHLKEHFHEMSPIFCTSDVDFEDIGPTKQNYITEHGLSEHKRRLLIGG